MIPLHHRSANAKAQLADLAIALQAVRGLVRRNVDITGAELIAALEDEQSEWLAAEWLAVLAALSAALPIAS